VSRKLAIASYPQTMCPLTGSEARTTQPMHGARAAAVSNPMRNCRAGDLSDPATTAASRLTPETKVSANSRPVVPRARRLR
jgi:hypothetical protein